MPAFDKTRLTPCPVLRPTEAEMADPVGYLSRQDIAKLGSEFGLVKLIPPENWNPGFSLSANFKFHTRLQKLSDLGLSTRSRKFFRDNINRFLKMRRQRQLKLYFKAESYGGDLKRAIKVYYYDLYVAIENFPDFKEKSDDKWGQLNKLFGIWEYSTKLKEQYETSLKDYISFLSTDEHQNFDFPESQSEEESGHCMICGKSDRPSQTLLCDNCDNAYHLSCLSTPLDFVPLGSWFCDKCLIGTGEYGFKEEVDIKYSLPEFFGMCLDFQSKYIRDHNNNQPMTLDDIERKFWQMVDTQNSEIEVKYGADIHNLRRGEISGFPTTESPGLDMSDPSVHYYIQHPWNLTKLPYTKGSLLNYINTSISGMTIPWIYIGSLFSTFCWHVEDHYTLSANYCHFGAAKKWYGIPSSDADRFEKLMKESAPNLFKKQPDLLHQLVTLISPMTLVENGIRCVYADQMPNEFVITYPRVFHAGFNSGFNFNEAVNFAMNNWLEFGEKSLYDYKLIRKESVFDHYNLVANIMKTFNRKRGSISASELDLVKRCIDSYENFINKQTQYLSQINTSEFRAIYNPRQDGERKKDFSIIHYEDEDESEEDTQSEDLCDLCRTYVSGQYCIMGNRKHKFGLETPKDNDEKNSSSEEVSRKMKISQLLTPETSPYEPSYHKALDVEKIQSSESSNNLALLRADNKRNFSEMQRYEHLIQEAKKNASDDETVKEKHNRRKSRRIQEKKNTVDSNASNVAPSFRHSKMKAVQVSSTLKQLNEKSSIKLCLECCVSHYYGQRNVDIPDESLLVYDMYPSQMKQLVHETKRNLFEVDS